MGYMPLTPFGRTVDAVLLHQQAAADHSPLDGPIASHMARPVSKWDALSELAAARKAYGLSDRDLSVLQALVSFLPRKEIEPQPGGPVVHPSNKTICERLNGMPCSTMRRHMAKLVSAGILIRRDSPNGKRYVRRYQGERTAYGFDLSPLALRFAEFSAAADAQRAVDARIRELRETISLMRRDVLNLALCGAAERPELADWDQYRDLADLTTRSLRRKLALPDLEQIEARLTAALDAAKTLLAPPQTEETGTCDAQIEQHYQNSKKDSLESEQAVAPPNARVTEEKDVADYAERPGTEEPRNCGMPASRPQGANLPLRLILSACGEIGTYAQGAIRHWQDLLHAAETVRPMMGIASSVWEDAKASIGATEAAVVIAAMLERFGEIRSPGGYLRHLSAKARSGQFSIGPMVMALVRQAAA